MLNDKNPTVEELTFAIGYKFTRVYKIVTRTRVKQSKPSTNLTQNGTLDPKLEKPRQQKLTQEDDFFSPNLEMKHLATIPFF